MTRKKKKALILIFITFIFILSESIEIKLENVNGIYNRVQSSGSSNSFEYVWNYTWGSGGEEHSRAIALDKSDNVYVVGEYSTYPGDFCITQFNKYGIEVWRKIWDTSAVPRDICLDNDGNIYVTGDKNNNILIVKFNNSGDYLWHRILDLGDVEYGQAIKSDLSNNIYIGANSILLKYDPFGTQIWNKTSSFSVYDIVLDDINNMYVTGGGGDTMLAKYDSSANKMWETSWDGAPSDRGIAICLDLFGNIFIAGDLNPSNDPDIFLVKFNSKGNYQWNSTWGGANNDYCYDLSIGSSNNMYIASSTNSFSGNYDAAILKFDNQGNLIDNKTWGYSSSDFCFGVARDTSNGIYITGRVRLGNNNDYFLVKYENLPIIKINSPKLYQFFAEQAPSFNISVIEPNLDSTWYSLNDGLNYTFTGTTGTINQTAWNACQDGSVKIRFYANSTEGCFSFKDIEVYKDSNPPVITINSPLPNQLFGNNTLNFNISIIETFLNSTWYSLNDGLNYTFTGTNGKINQTAWNSCGNGTVIIKFYANDLSGHLGYKSVIVRKDTSFPEIIIISPLQFQLFGGEAPIFNLTINESNLESSWYSLNMGLNYNFNGTSGKINQTAWNSCGNETITITFYANNTAGNIGYSEIKVFKDIIAPTLLINIPISHQIFGNQSPTFNITIIENNLNITWYSLNNGLNYTFTGLTGTINQTAWNGCENGTVTIKFFANDTMGNIGYKSIIVYKDITPPIILIHSPVNSQVFGTYPPDYNLSISEPNIDSIWYSLNDGLNYSISENSGKIDITAWNLCDNGNILFKFYANDTGGNIGYSEVIIEKNAYFWDLTSTPIFIDNTNPNYNWSKTARENPWCLGSGTWNDPYVIRNVIIDGKNSGSCIEIINSYVYFRIENCILFNAGRGTHPFYNGAIKLTKVHNGTLFNNTCSNNNGYGIFIENSKNNTLIENIANNNGYSGIYIEFSYEGNYLFNNTMNLNGHRGLYLVHCDYHIINGNIIENNVLIGLELWDSNYNKVYNNSVKGNYDGIYLYEECNNNELRFNKAYMNDHNGIVSGNGENNKIEYNTVYNNIEHGINLFGNYANISHNIVSFNGKSGIYVHDCNYTLISFNTVYNNTEDGILLYSMWEFCEGNNILNNTIFSNQMNGLLFMFSDKNNISGNLIENNQLKGIYLYSGSSRNLFYSNRIINNGLNALDDGSSNQWNNSIVGNFWDDYSGKDANDDGIGDSPYNISGTADSKDKIPIWWDPPVLSIVSPESNTLFGISSLSFEISIDEGFSNTTWYSLNGSLIYTFTGMTGTINQTAWDMFENGTVTIRFYINDSRGYIAFKEVVVQKDIIDPEIIIISPTHNELFGNTTIYFELLINEPNLDTIWYSINNSENYFPSSTSGFIDQEVWDTWGNGTIIIKYYANDTVGNEAFNEVLIRKDIFPPSWIVEPEDQLIEYGDEFYYKLDASDLSGISHWWINDTIHFNINDIGEITNIVSLSVGVYWVDVRVYDLATNYCNSTIKINVQDTTSPIWMVEPKDQLIEYGNEFYYKLDASDLSGISYWWINDTIHFNINDNGEITNIIDLDEGEYSVEIRAYDNYDNYCSKTIKITVKGRSNPPSIHSYKLEMIFLILGILTVSFLLNWRLRKSRYQKLR